MRKCSNLPKNPSMEGIMCKLDEIMKKRETVYALARKYNVQIGRASCRERVSSPV